MVINQDIANMDFKTAFNIFKSLMDMKDDQHKDIYKKIKQGFEFHFNIYDYLYKNVEEYPIRNAVRIRGQFFDLDAYYDELEKREKILKDFLMGQSEEIELTYSGDKKE